MIVTLSDGTRITLPIIHFGVMGTANSGKSELCSTMEKPLLVIATDPYDKMEAYRDKGIPDEKEYTGQFGQPVTIIRSVKTKAPIIQIEGFYDEEPNAPRAMQALISRMPQVREEVNAGKWKSIVLDSWSQMEYIAQLRRTTGAFAGVDSVYSAAKDDCKSVLISRLAPLKCHVGVVLHLDSKMSDVGGGTMLYSLKAIGQLKTDVPSNLGEMYRAYSALDVNAKPYGIRYALQTLPMGGFECGTRIGAPNNCPNEFTALFTNWITRRAAQLAAMGAATEPSEPATTGDVAPQEEKRSE